MAIALRFREAGVVLWERLRVALPPSRRARLRRKAVFSYHVCGQVGGQVVDKGFSEHLDHGAYDPSTHWASSLFNLQTKFWPPCVADFLDSMPIVCWPNTGENAGNLWAFFLRSLQSWLHTTHLCFKSDQISSHLADCSLGGYPTRVYSHTKFIPIRYFSRGAPRH